MTFLEKLDRVINDVSDEMNETDKLLKAEENTVKNENCDNLTDDIKSSSKKSSVSNKKEG